MTKTKDFQHLYFNQYESADKLLARWNLYKYSVPKIDIYETGIDHLKLTGSENIFEVGCGEGNVLLNLRRHGHFGKLVGLEINENMFRDAIKVQETEKLSPIDFIVGSADKLPFPDKSFDVVLAFFMLYHMPNVEKTLLEWRRILKDDGKILIATASSGNKPKHKSFKKIIEKFIGETSPPQFSHFFSLENGEEQLKNVFNVTDKFVYKGEIKLSESSPYLKALDSVKDMFDPTPSVEKWKEARSIVEQKVEREIEKEGYFTDDVERGFFICEKI